MRSLIIFTTIFITRLQVLAKFTTLDLMNRLPTEIVRPIFELYTEATNAYNAKDWPNAARLFEQTIVSHKLRQTLESNCRNRCEENPLKYQINKNIREADKFNLGFGRISDILNENPNDENTAFGELMERVLCLKICREEHPFYAIMEHDRKYLQSWIVEDIEKKKPYDFLQFCYYKMGLYEKACQAAMTFYNAPGNREHTCDSSCVKTS